VSLDRVERTWNQLGEENPMWAVLTTREDWDEEEFFRTGQEEIDEVLAYARSLGPLGGGRALDFGCGLGRLTRALAGSFESAVGVDIAESMIEGARQLNAEIANAEFVLNQRSDLSAFEDGTFDFVYSNITLQHMPPNHAEGYVREFGRVLAPAGVTVFQVPSHRTNPPAFPRLADAARSAVRALRRTKRMEMHAIPRERVLGVLDGAGLEALDVKWDGRAGEGWEGYRYAARRPKTS
jgi:SAM-dependent methyltransferase